MEAYLDNAATTRCYREVADLTEQLFLAEYGNPSSMHTKGVEAEQYVRRAAQTLAGLLKVKEKEIFFTSGGTESDNWALFGTAFANRRRAHRIIISPIEHAAVLAPAAELEKLGYEVVRLHTDREGRIDLSELEEALREDTLLVSVMMVNNEIGTVEPVEEIGRLIHTVSPQTYFHVDAIQAFGKYRIRPKKLHVDLLSVSSHKIHGPKGAGFLYIDERVKIAPLIYGGGQQAGLRSGTDNVPGIAGMALAADKLCSTLEENAEHMYTLKKQLAKGISGMEGTVIHGPSVLTEGAPHILNASFTGIRSEVLLHTLEDRGICVSSGSACSSHKRSGSATMAAIGASKEEAESSVRFSFSELTAEEEISCTLQVLREVVPQLRRFTRK